MIELNEKAPDLIRLCYVSAWPPNKQTKQVLRFRVSTSRLLYKTKISTHYNLFSWSKTGILNAQTWFINKEKIPFVLQSIWSLFRHMTRVTSRLLTKRNSVHLLKEQVCFSSYNMILTHYLDKRNTHDITNVKLYTTLISHLKSLYWDNHIVVYKIKQTKSLSLLKYTSSPRRWKVILDSPIYYYTVVGAFSL